MQSLLFKPQVPLVVADGLGVDSTAMLVGMHQRGMRPDLILFADTGSEKQKTYDYLPVRQAYLASIGFPPVIVVRYEPKNFKNYPPYKSLGENCLTNGTLPSLAFGFKSCSQKWKVAPQDAFVSEWVPALRCWALGGRVVKCIGYDDGPKDSKRYAHVEGYEDPRYEYRYPLREWHWDREECIRQIRAAGLPVPCKSACFFCPATKPEELKELSPENLRFIVAMEARAHPRLTAIDGLWRCGCKGTRGGVAKPGRMTDYIRAKGLLPAEEVDRLWQSIPKRIEEYQAAVQGGSPLADFLSAEDLQTEPPKPHEPDVV